MAESRRDQDLLKDLTTLIQECASTVAPAVTFFDNPFHVFDYPGGGTYQVFQDGKFHETSTSGEDRGMRSAEEVGRSFYDFLLFYVLKESMTRDTSKDYFTREVSTRATELVRRYEAAPKTARPREGVGTEGGK